ncbi:MAG: hypothetical protein AAGF81_22580 [Pseudomonadota bacterium]
MSSSILMYGGKAQTMICEDNLKDAGIQPAYIFDKLLDKLAFDTKAKFGSSIEDLKEFLHAADSFVVGIGGLHGYARHTVSKILEEKFSLLPVSVSGRHSFIDNGCSIGKGLQINACAVVHKFCEIGDYCIINTNATVDHESALGNGVHVMEGAVITGGVQVGDFATIGANSTILPELNIGTGAVVGAGAVVSKDVEPYTVVAGVPARELRMNEPKCDLAPLDELI